MVKVKRDILDRSLSNVPNRKMTPKYITVHNTANTTKGADAEMHARYQHNGSGGRKASWHYQVDDKEIWQTLEDDQQGWHAGDGKGNGNTQSIGIEICENSDGDFDKAVKNAQSLIKKLMDKHNIPLSNVVTHKHWSGKDCPRKLLDTWDAFKNDIDGKVETNKPAASKPSKPNTGDYKGNSIVDYLKHHKQDSSFSNRSKLAKKHGISNYKGTPSQNTKLLNALRGKKTGKPKPSKKYPLPTGVLRRGSKGNDVRQLQRALNAANFKVGKADGIFGAKTEDAVRRFQSVHDAYNVDGVYGPRTKTRLDKVVN